MSENLFRDLNGAPERFQPSMKRSIGNHAAGISLASGKAMLFAWKVKDNRKSQ